MRNSDQLSEEVENLPGSKRLLWKTIVPRIIFAIIAITIFTALLISLDLKGAYVLISAIGILLFLAPIPYFFSGLIDSFGWRLLFPENKRPKLLRISIVRFATEALYMSIPGGIVFSDPLKPVLLAKKPGIKPSESIPAMGARRTLILVTHGMFIILSAILAWGELGEMSKKLIGVQGLNILTMSVGAFIFILGFFSTLGLIFGGIGKKFYKILYLLPVKRLRRYLYSKRSAFIRTDFSLRKFKDHPKKKILTAIFSFFCVWLLESIETWLFLQLIGASISLPAIMAFESVMTVVRSILFFLPSGIGVQDISYVALVRAFYPENADAASTAVILLRRLRETLFVFLGYFLLLTEKTEAKISLNKID